MEEQDGALKICSQLRDHMYARLLRWQDAAPTERTNMIPMNYDQYTAWSENARLARMEYLDGQLNAEGFLRRIDTNHELEGYEADGDMICSVPWGMALGEHPIGGTGQGDAQSCGLDAETFKCTCSVSGVSLAIGIAASKAPDHTVGCIAVAGG